MSSSREPGAWQTFWTSVSALAGVVAAWAAIQALNSRHDEPNSGIGSALENRTAAPANIPTGTTQVTPAPAEPNSAATTEPASADPAVTQANGATNAPGQPRRTATSLEIILSGRWHHFRNVAKAGRTLLMGRTVLEFGVPCENPKALEYFTRTEGEVQRRPAESGLVSEKYTIDHYSENGVVFKDGRSLIINGQDSFILDSPRHTEYYRRCG